MHQSMGLLEKQDWPCIHLVYAGTCLNYCTYYCYYCYYCDFESPGGASCGNGNLILQSHARADDYPEYKVDCVCDTALQHHPTTTCNLSHNNSKDSLSSIWSKVHHCVYSAHPDK